MERTEDCGKEGRRKEKREGRVDIHEASPPHPLKKKMTGIG